MSTHSVDVILIKEILTHPNADQLEIIMVGEFSCCVRKGDFKSGELAVYIEPDYVVDTTRPEFEFLGGKGNVRIKVKKLRGIMSQGLLVHAPEGFQEGDNVLEHFGITRYEPEIKLVKTRTNAVKPPRQADFPKYDLENWRKYSRLLEDGELVQVTEKIHGTNARYKWADDKLHCGSRSLWVGNEHPNPWHMAVEQNPWIKSFCENFPDLTVYGEVFGWVQDLKYGAKEGQMFFRAFDLFSESENRWLNWDEIIDHIPLGDGDFDEGEHVMWVPLLALASYSKELINELVDGKSQIVGADHLREGIVVKPVVERNDIRLGRVALKVVSNDYLERSK